MNITLNSHRSRYDLSLNDAFLSVVTGLSGVPYARRHWELAERSKVAWGHRVIAVIEVLPFVGGLAAVIERVAAFVYGRFYKQKEKVVPLLEERETAVPLIQASQEEGRVSQEEGWVFSFDDPVQEESRVIPLTEAAKEESRVIPLTEAAKEEVEVSLGFQKMWNNARKAIEEHGIKDPVYASLEEGLPPLETLQSKPSFSLQFLFYEAAEKGRRKTMEDFYFCIELEEGVLAAVLDGHGGHQVAELAHLRVQEKFAETLKRVAGNVRQAFNELLDEIQAEVFREKYMSDCGTTAVICYIEKATHLVYTATVGDSEANIYRNKRSIPLSCLRNWSCIKEAQRVAAILKKPEILKTWPKADPKTLRFPHQMFGINLSRSLGDKSYHLFDGKKGVIHKPKISVNRLLPGDLLILASDGLKDFPETEIVQCLAEGQNHAERLVDYALNEKGGMDNVTVIALSIQESK